MTIAVAFRCVDGIMLCADTQETFSGYLKRKQPKLEIRGERSSSSQSPRAVFAGAGDDGDLVDVLVDKLWRAMEPKGADGLEAMLEAAENELTAQYQRLVPLYPSGVPGIAFLVGVWAPVKDDSGVGDTFDLLKISGPLLKRNVILDAIGCGDILTTYLTSRLLWVKSWLAQATPVGIYVVDQAKEHIEGCGGETQLVTIRGNGEIELHSSEHVRAETERLRSIDAIARRIVGLTMGSFNSEQHFGLLLQDTCKGLYKLAKIEPGSEKSQEPK